MKLINSNKEIYYSLTLLIVPLVFLFGIQIHANLSNNDNIKNNPASVIQNKYEYRINPFDIIEIEARSAIVKDLNSNNTIYQKNSGLILPLASITKLMTALVINEYDISRNDIVTISATALQTDGESHFFLNQKFKLKELSKIMLIESSNDAAVAISEHFEDQTGKDFVTEMNSIAGKIGMKDSIFFNQTGLDLSNGRPGSVGTANDLAILFEYIIRKYPEIFEYTKMINYNTYSEDGLYYQLENTNGIIPLLKNLIGTKTGYTDLAGGNLGVIIDPDLNKPTVIIVLGSTFAGRFNDVLELNNKLSDYLNYQLNQN